MKSIRFCGDINRRVFKYEQVSLNFHLVYDTDEPDEYGLLFSEWR